MTPITRRQQAAQRQGKFQQIREQVDAGKLTITQASPEQMAQWRREREERRRVRSARRKRF
jgi:hypothetical protein